MSAVADAPIDGDELTALLSPLIGFRSIVLAVSGGSDSTALLYLVSRWRRELHQSSASLLAVTVDHGLRPEAADEAVAVARLAQALDVPHRTMRWSGPVPTTGLQAAARTARYRLLTEAASGLAATSGEPVAIVTAHTADDQAETLIMRLARGSGVDGLAAIPPRSEDVPAQLSVRAEAIPPCVLLRPLLGIPRSRLIATLAAQAIPFADDPSNRDRRFERVRIRDAMASLAEIGLTRDALVRSAERLRSAREVLEQAADDLEARALTTVGGLVCRIDVEALAAAPGETAVRLIRRVLGRMGGSARAADLGTVELATTRLTSSDSRSAPPAAFTVGGCIVEPARVGDWQMHRTAQVYREPDRDEGLPRLALAPGTCRLWDERFLVGMQANLPFAVEIAALGSAWADCLARFPCLQRLGLPAGAARGAPAFWGADGMIAVPPLARLAHDLGEGEAAAFLAGPRVPGPAGRTTPACTADFVPLARRGRAPNSTTENAR